MLKIKRIWRQSPIHKFLAFVYYFYADYRLRKNGYIFKPVGIRSIFYLPYIKTDIIQKSIYKYKNYFEFYSLDYICKKWMGGAISNEIRDKIILDIGTNIGNHTLYFLNECEAKFVYCFEPATETFEMLRKNISINHLESRTKLIKAGVGSISGKGSVSAQKTKNTGFTQIVSSENGNIEMIAIDETNINDKIGLIKIDIEGYEVEALKGMIETIRRNKPYLMIEVDVDNYVEVCALLGELGYDHEALNEYIGTDNHLFYPKK